MEFIIFFGAVAVGGFFVYRMISNADRAKSGIRPGEMDRPDESV